MIKEKVGRNDWKSLKLARLAYSHFLMKGLWNLLALLLRT